MTAEPDQRATGRYQQAFWFALLLATALTLAGTSLAIGAYSSEALPQTVVRDYFAALQSGDAAGALGYGAVPDGAHGLLTAETLARQNEIGPISDVTVGAVNRTGDTAEVSVDYTLGFASGPDVVSDTVPVVRHGHGWRLARSAEQEDLDPSQGSTLAEVMGVALPTGPYDLFPGALPVTFATPNLVLGTSSRVVRFADGGTLEVAAEVSAAGRRLIAPALDRALSTCLAGRAAVQTACPVPDSAADVPGSMLGRQTALLAGKAAGQLYLTVGSSDGRIDIAATAPVDVTYTELDDNNMPVPSTSKSVGLRAHCFATDPGTIVWDAS